MLVITGTASKGGEVPLPHAEAMRYFADIPSFVEKIEEVEKVKPLGEQNCYLVSHHPIGALNYFTTVVYCMRVERHAEGFRFVPLDFDHEKFKSPHQVLKGFVEGALDVKSLSDGTTQVDVTYTLKVEFPLPSALKLVPRALVQTTADGIMTLKVAASIESMYKKVFNDFSAMV